MYIYLQTWLNVQDTDWWKGRKRRRCGTKGAGQERDRKVVIRVRFCAYMLLSLSNTAGYFCSYKQIREPGVRVRCNGALRVYNGGC